MSVMSNDQWLPHQVDTGWGRVAYNVMGEGPAVVLVHGTPSTSSLWRQVAPALSENHTVFLYDLPGFGASTLSSNPAPVGLIRRQAEVLVELIGAWQLERPAVVGHDIGGGVVTRAHLLHGLPVERMVLIDAAVVAPWITPRTRDLRQRVDEIREMPVAEFAQLVLDHLGSATVMPLAPDVWQRLFGQWEGSHGQGRYLDNLLSFDEQDTEDFAQLLPSVKVPVLLLWGDADRWLPLEMGQRLASLLPNSQLTVVPGAGHFAMEDQPQLVLEALEGFLAHSR